MSRKRYLGGSASVAAMLAAGLAARTAPAQIITISSALTSNQNFGAIDSLNITNSGSIAGSLSITSVTTVTNAGSVERSDGGVGVTVNALNGLLDNDALMVSRIEDMATSGADQTVASSSAQLTVSGFTGGVSAIGLSMGSVTGDVVNSGTLQGSVGLQSDLNVSLANTLDGESTFASAQNDLTDGTLDARGLRLGSLDGQLTNEPNGRIEGSIASQSMLAATARGTAAHAVARDQRNADAIGLLLGEQTNVRRVALATASADFEVLNQGTIVGNVEHTGILSAIATGEGTALAELDSTGTQQAIGIVVQNGSPRSLDLENLGEISGRMVRQTDGTITVRGSERAIIDSIVSSIATVAGVQARQVVGLDNAGIISGEALETNTVSAVATGDTVVAERIFRSRHSVWGADIASLDGTITNRAGGQISGRASLDNTLQLDLRGTIDRGPALYEIGGTALAIGIDVGEPDLGFASFAALTTGDVPDGVQRALFNSGVISAHASVRSVIIGDRPARESLRTLAIATGANLLETFDTIRNDGTVSAMATAVGDSAGFVGGRAVGLAAYVDTGSVFENSGVISARFTGGTGFGSQASGVDLSIQPLFSPGFTERALTAGDTAGLYVRNSGEILAETDIAQIDSSSNSFTETKAIGLRVPVVDGLYVENSNRIAADLHGLLNIGLASGLQIGSPFTSALPGAPEQTIHLVNSGTIASDVAHEGASIAGSLQSYGARIRAFGATAIENDGDITAEIDGAVDLARAAGLTLRSDPFDFILRRGLTAGDVDLEGSTAIFMRNSGTISATLQQTGATAAQVEAYGARLGIRGDAVVHNEGAIMADLSGHFGIGTAIGLDIYCASAILPPNSGIAPFESLSAGVADATTMFVHNSGVISATASQTSAVDGEFAAAIGVRLPRLGGVLVTNEGEIRADVSGAAETTIAAAIDLSGPVLVQPTRTIIEDREERAVASLAAPTELPEAGEILIENWGVIAATGEDDMQTYGIYAEDAPLVGDPDGTPSGRGTPKGLPFEGLVVNQLAGEIDAPVAIAMAQYKADVVNWSGGAIRGLIRADGLDVVNVLPGPTITAGTSFALDGAGWLNINTTVPTNPVEFVMAGTVSNTGVLNVNPLATLRLQTPADIEVGEINISDTSTLITEVTPDAAGGMRTTGNANVAGTFTVDLQPGLYDLDRTYVIIDAIGAADSAVLGDFHTINENDTLLLDVVVTQTDNQLLVGFARTPFDEVDGLTGNAPFVGEGIERGYDPDRVPQGDEPDLNDVLTTLFQIEDPDLYNDILNNWSAQTYAQLLGVALDIGRPFQEVLRSYLGGSYLWPYRIRVADGTAEPESAVGSSSSNWSGFSIWARPVGRWTDRDGDAFGAGYQTDIYGAVFGTDYRFNRSAMIGVTVSYFEADVDFDNGTDSADVERLQFGAYGEFELNNFYLNAVVSFGDDDYQASRQLIYTGNGCPAPTCTAQLTGAYDGDVFQAFGELGYRYTTRSEIELTPYIGFFYVDIDTDPFVETGAGGSLNLEVEEAESRSVQMSLGGRIAKTFQSRRTLIAPYARAEWRHEFEEGRDGITASFAGAQDIRFTSLGARKAEDFVLLGAGLSADFGNGLTAYLDYAAEFGGELDAHTLQGGLRYRF